MLSRFLGMGRLLGKKVGQDAPPSDCVFLMEEDVNTENLREIFKSAFFNVVVNDDGDLKITADCGTKVIVAVDHERKFVRVMGMFQLKADTAEIDRLRFINRLNSNVVCCCFSMPRDDVLAVEFFVLIEGGVTAFQIVNSYRRLVRTAAKAIGQHDDDDVVGG